MVGPMRDEATNELAEKLDAAWRRFRDTVDHVGAAGLERPTASGWTAKEMLGHMAFWDETTEPVLIAIFRGDSLPDDWAFGSGYTHPHGDDWPAADVHNAREAAWAKPRPAPEVLARLDRAHAGAMVITRSLTDEELRDPRYQDYIAGSCGHYEEHRQELAALL